MIGISVQPIGHRAPASLKGCESPPPVRATGSHFALQRLTRSRIVTHVAPPSSSGALQPAREEPVQPAAGTGHLGEMAWQGPQIAIRVDQLRRPAGLLGPHRDAGEPGVACQEGGDLRLALLRLQRAGAIDKNPPGRTSPAAWSRSLA